jgi:hypothetical protein
MRAAARRRRRGYVDQRVAKYVQPVRCCIARMRAARRAQRRRAPATRHNDFLWAKILLLHAENLFIDFGAES